MLDGMGRRKGKRYDIRVSIRLESGMYRELREVLGRMGVGVSELVRLLLRRFLEEVGSGGRGEGIGFVKEKASRVESVWFNSKLVERLNKS